MTWPNFFIVGTSKAGTTSLYNYLEKIHDVYIAPKGKIHYFFPNEFNKKSSKEEYLLLFENTENKKAIGEYSAYLKNFESPELIKSTIPNARIIICIRDPVERAFSHYLGSLRSKDETQSFDDAFEKHMNPILEESKFYKKYIETGLYYEKIKKFLDIFGENQVLILVFEEFIKEPEKNFKIVLNFLQLKNEIPEIVGNTYNAYAEPLGYLGTSLVRNKTINKISKKILSKEKRVNLLRFVTNKKSKKPKLNETKRRILEEFYKNDIGKLEGLIKIKLPWYTKNNLNN